MAVIGEGTIEIPLDEFWQFVEKYHPHQSEELAYGKPTVNLDNQVIEINYAYSSEASPHDWAEKPECLKEWDDE